MAAAAKMGKPHGMLSILGLEDSSLDSFCAQIRQKMGPDTVCQIANYLFPTGRVVSGNKDALDAVQVQYTLCTGILKMLKRMDPIGPNP